MIGCRPYEFVPREYGKPLVVAGFEPLDILQSVYWLLRQLREGRCEVENQYARVVPWQGNPVALDAIARTMQLRPYFEWRGLGFISHSALRLRDEYAHFDAERRFSLPGVRVADPKSCQCGEVLKGVLKPWECKVFGTACTPETPIGTCMVSPEGACAAYYNFGRFTRQRLRRRARYGTEDDVLERTSGRAAANRGCGNNASPPPTAPAARRRRRCRAVFVESFQSTAGTARDSADCCSATPGWHDHRLVRRRHCSSAGTSATSPSTAP